MGVAGQSPVGSDLPPMTDAVARAGSEKAKMLEGRLYDPWDPELVSDRERCRKLTNAYNNTQDEDVALRLDILVRMLGDIDREHPPNITPPFTPDYGYNIHLGRDVKLGASSVILDCAQVSIGDYVEIGPNVQIYTVGHPIDPVLRNGREGPQYAKPVRISSYATVGGGAIITGPQCAKPVTIIPNTLCTPESMQYAKTVGISSYAAMGGEAIIEGGVSIGEGAKVGPGAVVTKDVPPAMYAAGNPASIISAVR